MVLFFDQRQRPIILYYDDVLKKEVKFSMPNVMSVEIEGHFAIARSETKTMRIHLHDGARTFI